MKISVVIIAKNAEDLIADAISSVDFADEVIVIDNNSTDRTKEISEYFKAKVYSLSDNDFSKLRNFGLEKSRGDWILYIDSDERVSSLLAEDIKKNSENYRFKKIGAFKVMRKNFYFGRHESPYIEYMERFFKKTHISGWNGRLHESPIASGDIGILNGYLLHYTHKDLSSMLEKTIEWSKIEAELRLKSSHPKMTWWRFPRVMMSAFVDSYFRKKSWKMGTAGLLESMYQSFSTFITYARLWELQQKNK